MKPILIIKAGTTVPGIRSKRGDFEDWIMQGMELPAERFQVAAVYEGALLPAIEDVAAIVVTGSAAMVTDQAQWSEASAAYLRQAVERETPVLGICYGHQLLAHALRGTVDYHPQGREIGTREITLSATARDDRLLAQLPAAFPAHVTHSQSVIDLPSDAVILAGNAFDPHHAVRFAKCAWGVQFHPEFDAEIMRAYLSEREEVLQEEGLDAKKLSNEVTEAPQAASILRTFNNLIAHA